MRIRKNKNPARRLAECARYLVPFPGEQKGKWRALFGNGRPIHLEIGCGKGAFLAGMALRHPEVNFIALEKYRDVLVLAVEKAREAGLSNAFYLLGDARELGGFFAPGEVDRIYLNFSDPWPKTKHRKRRLTHPDFLNIYKAFLLPGAEIHLKTDSRPLFDFSLEQLESSGFSLGSVTRDLYAGDTRENVATEYEEQISARGIPICRLEAVLK